MPSFTTQLPNLQAMGPLVDIYVWVGTPVEEALKKAGSKVPEPVPSKGMIDTGATGSVIHPAIAQQLGLQPVGVVLISTPSSENVPCLQYVVRLIFPNNVIVEGLAIEAPLRGQHIQCLMVVMYWPMAFLSILAISTNSRSVSDVRRLSISSSSRRQWIQVLDPAGRITNQSSGWLIATADFNR